MLDLAGSRSIFSCCALPSNPAAALINTSLAATQGPHRHAPHQDNSMYNDLPVVQNCLRLCLISNLGRTCGSCSIDELWQCIDLALVQGLLKYVQSNQTLLKTPYYMLCLCHHNDNVPGVGHGFVAHTKSALALIHERTGRIGIDLGIAEGVRSWMRNAFRT